MEKPHIKDLIALRLVVELADWFNQVVADEEVPSTHYVTVPDFIGERYKDISDTDCGQVVSLRRWSHDFNVYKTHKNAWVSYNTEDSFVVRIHYTKDLVTILSILNPMGEEVFQHIW